jgi:hypothetical protein
MQRNMSLPPAKHVSCAGWNSRRSSSICAAIVASFVILFAGGCTSLRAGKHPATFASAANLVVQNSTDAYGAANDLHEREEVSAGVLAVEEGKDWKFSEITPFISPEEMKARTQTLDVLKLYAQSIADVAAGADSTALSKAAKSAASSMEGLGSTINTEVGGGKSGASISKEAADGFATALLALGESLAAKKANEALPGITTSMDPHIASLCDLLTSDIGFLRRQAKVDYGSLARQEWTFITLYKAKMSPVELHDEIEKLPTFHDDAQSTDAKLADLETAIGKLKKAHSDLMNAANSTDKEALKDKLAGFESAGSNLGNFYQSLSSKSESSDKSSSDSSSSKSAGSDKSTDTNKKE